MSKQAEAELILKLYELRREETMRKARDWHFQGFHPHSVADFHDALFSEHSGYLRMVTSYWEMAAALVHNGAISLEFFNDTNGEHIGVFAKYEPFLNELRASYGTHFLANVEKLIDATPEGRQKVAAMQERMKKIMAEVAHKQAKAAEHS